MKGPPGSEYIAGILPGEPPFHECPSTIELAIPRSCFGRESAFAQALTGEQSDLDLGLIEPTAALWSVVDREAAPQLRPLLKAEVIGE